MENKILMLLCIVVVILFYLLVYYRNKANKIYTESDKLLDKILENSHIDQIEVNEGKTSALASKISKVQEKLLIETGRAENEKVRFDAARARHGVRTVRLRQQDRGRRQSREQDQGRLHLPA